MKRVRFTRRFWLSAGVGVLVAATVVRIHGSFRKPEPPVPLPAARAIGQEISLESPRPGRIRSHLMASEYEAESAPRVAVESPVHADRSNVEAFFVRHLDPWFRRTGGWQIYNPDRLDRGQESARSTSMAFAAGLRYRHSF